MPYFTDAADLYRCLGGFFRELARDPSIGAKIAASNLVINFVYREPDAELTVDTKSPPPAGSFATVIEGPSDVAADVRMTMKADLAHRFWFGRVNLATAVAKGEIKTEGPLSAVLKLLPIVRPAYSLYPEFLKHSGMTDKLLE